MDGALDEADQGLKDPGGARDRDPRRGVTEAPRGLVDHRDATFQLAEFVIAGDQQIAEPKDLLVAPRQLGVEICGVGSTT